ncbi:hypothetical protein BH20ACI3_BH20ACI3_04930 [soil metagenome]
MITRILYYFSVERKQWSLRSIMLLGVMRCIDGRCLEATASCEIVREGALLMAINESSEGIQY